MDCVHAKPVEPTYLIGYAGPQPSQSVTHCHKWLVVLSLAFILATVLDFTQNLPMLPVKGVHFNNGTGYNMYPTEYSDS